MNRTEPRPPRIVVFAALGWECRPALRALRDVRRLRGLGTTAWRGESALGEVWVVKTGVGPRRAGAAAAAIDLSACGFAVSTGCAGGLVPSLRPGDLVIASEVQMDAARHDADPMLSARLLDLAAARALSCRAGPIHCSPTLLASREEKERAAAAGALAVDMEGGPIAAAAAAAAIPFAAVRAVIDAADHDVSVLVRIGDRDTGRVRPLALAGEILRHPRTVAELWRLGRAQRAADAALSRFFAVWLGSAA